MQSNFKHCIYLIQAEWYAAMNYTNIGSDDGLLPLWRPANIWTNAGLFLIRIMMIIFNEVLIKIQQFW